MASKSPFIRNSVESPTEEKDGQRPSSSSRPLKDWQFPTNAIDSHNRMRLYDDENDWALDIKDAIEDTPDIDNLTDFQYAQLAIVDQDDIEMALERARKMQDFKRQYDIRDSVECGLRCMKEFVDLLPGHWLSLSSAEGQCVLVADVSKLTVDRIRTSSDGLHTWLAGTYFMCHVLSSEFYAMRHGFTILAENQGYDFKKNFGLDLHSKLWKELASVYPLQISKMKNYNTGLVYNMLVRMAKSFVTEEIHSRFEVGCVCELGTLDKLYATPNQRVANERLMIRLHESLRRRYQNETDFRLPKQCAGSAY